MRPYFESDGVTIYCADCREILPSISADAAILDPPYGDTSLDWDVPVAGWLPSLDVPTFWCFGSLRSLRREPFAGWQLAQDLVWEKHNGSNFHADRFKRVHELVVQFYRDDVRWSDIYRKPLYTNDATKRALRRKARPAHTGNIGAASYCSHDGGPRMMRSVLRVRSAHGVAVHPTQKPVGIVLPLLDYSVPPAGIVLDPFMGSGTTLVAARQIGRRAIGIEIDERYCELAAQRLRQGELFALDLSD